MLYRVHKRELTGVAAECSPRRIVLASAKECMHAVVDTYVHTLHGSCLTESIAVQSLEVNKGPSDVGFREVLILETWGNYSIFAAVPFQWCPHPGSFPYVIPLLVRLDIKDNVIRTYVLWIVRQDINR